MQTTSAHQCLVADCFALHSPGNLCIACLVICSRYHAGHAAGLQLRAQLAPTSADIPQAVRVWLHVRGRVVEGLGDWLGVGGVLTLVPAAAHSPDRLGGLATVWGPVAQTLATAASR